MHSPPSLFQNNQKQKAAPTLQQRLRVKRRRVLAAEPEAVRLEALEHARDAAQRALRARAAAAPAVHRVAEQPRLQRAGARREAADLAEHVGVVEAAQVGAVVVRGCCAAGRAAAGRRRRHYGLLLAAREHERRHLAAADGARRRAARGAPLVDADVAEAVAAALDGRGIRRLGGHADEAADVVGVVMMLRCCVCCGCRC